MFWFANLESVVIANTICLEVRTDRRQEYILYINVNTLLIL